MKISIYDMDLNRVLIIGDLFVSCLWSEGYNSCQSFTLELNEAEEIKKKIKLDYYVGRDDRPTVMVIKSIQFREKKIIISGRQATRCLDDVAFIGTINDGSMIDKSVSEAYNKSRKYKNLEFKNTDLKIKYPHQISHKSFLELCETMCQDTDCGIRVEKSGNKLIASFYNPAENPNLIFSEYMGNLIVESFAESVQDFKNFAVVLGQGSGKERIQVEVDMTSGSDRRELVVDARNEQQEDGESLADYKKRLMAKGAEKLIEKKGILDCRFYPAGEDFGKKFDLGDIITVRLYAPDQIQKARSAESNPLNFDGILKARIIRFTEKQQKNEMTVNIEVGRIMIMR